MKSILVVIAIVVSAQLFAGNNTTSNHHKYCTEMKDGKIVVMHEGKELVSAVTLSNGTTITTDGYVLKKDGSKMMLQESECVDVDGKVMPKKIKKKDKPKMEPSK